MNIQEIREKYPQYEDMSDEQVARGLHQKHYSDMDFGAFVSKIGIGAMPDINQIRAEVKAERKRPASSPRKFSVSDLILPGMMVDPNRIFETLEAMDTLEPGEATIREAMGRGMQDVYQGAEQLGKHTGKQLTEDPDSLLSLALKTNPVTAALAQILEKTYTKGDAEKIDQELKSEIGLYDENNPGFQVSRVAGNIATPLALIPGAGKGLAAKTVAGALTGMAGGATQPVTTDDYAKTKAIQTAAGGTIGAALPGTFTLAGKAGTGVKDFTKALFNPNYADDIQKGLIKTVGPSREKIVQALSKADDTMTSGQAVAKANRAAADDFGGTIPQLEKQVSKEPGLGDAIKTIYKKQAAGRAKAIDALGGTDDNIDRLVARRSARTGPLYEAVKHSKAKVKTKPVIEQIDDLISGSKNEPDVTTPLKSIKRRLFDGDKLDESPENLMSLSKAIGKMMNKKVEGEPVYNTKVLAEVKDALDDQIGQVEKAYRTALNVHKGMSRPVDRARTGKVLKKALESPIEKEKPAPFAAAVDDSRGTIKKATGFKKGSLEKTLTKKEMANVNKVADELKTQTKEQKMASDTRGTLGSLSAEENVHLPRILSRPVVIANALLSRIGKGHSEQYKKVLAEVIENPDALHKMLALPASDPTRKAATDIARQMSILGTTQTTARGQNNAP